MKKLLSIATVYFAVMLFSSCGTLSVALTHGNSHVFMMQAPKDLEVTCNGVPLDITSEMFAGKSRSHDNGYVTTTTTTSYYASAVKLNHKHKATIELYSPSLNKRATVVLKPRASKNIIWADILLTGSIGLWVDIPTGNLKFLTPRMVDVNSALAGKTRKEWLSQGKMKRMAKRNAKRSS